mmetsp:Transcript_156/g.344  ORF Transcript_156/g.344 Transcript_156/m.344 type:complete len:323 (-) Transcript_156:225-1193(-)
MSSLDSPDRDEAKAFYAKKNRDFHLLTLQLLLPQFLPLLHLPSFDSHGLAIPRSRPPKFVAVIILARTFVHRMLPRILPQGSHGDSVLVYARRMALIVDVREQYLLECEYLLRRQFHGRIDDAPFVDGTARGETLGSFISVEIDGFVEGRMKPVEVGFDFLRPPSALRRPSGPVGVVGVPRRSVGEEEIESIVGNLVRVTARRRFAGGPGGGVHVVPMGIRLAQPSRRPSPPPPLPPPSLLASVQILGVHVLPLIDQQLKLIVVILRNTLVDQDRYYAESSSTIRQDVTLILGGVPGTVDGMIRGDVHLASIDAVVMTPLLG